jgi:drug/metabolite transporter (DMT)-like permease
MTWQLSMALFFVFVVSSNLWRRHYSQKSKLPGRTAPALAEVTGKFPLGVIVGLSIGDFYINLSPSTIFALLVMAIGVGVASWLIFVVTRNMPLALFQTLFQLQPITVVIAGWLFLQEGLSGTQILGSVLLLCGAVLAANSARHASHSTIDRKYIILAVLCAVSLGGGIVAEKVALGHMSLGAYYIVGYGLQTVAMCLIAQKDLRMTRWKDVSRYDLFGSMTMGALNACMGFFFIYSLRSTDNVGLVAALSTFELPLTALAAYFVLKERDISLKLIFAVIIAFAGLLVTAS